MAVHTTQNIIDLACRAGRIMLENGGEIYRVEQTINYVCKAYGIEECESFATPTVIIISVTDQEGMPLSRMLRITSRQINLDKVAAVNYLSRSLWQSPPPFTELVTKLAEIESIPPYPLWITILASSSGAGAFTLIFGGGLRELACGVLLGALLNLVVCALKKIEIGDFTINLVGGGVAAFGGWLAAYTGVILDWWIVALSSLMLLVPGLLLTNALRDIAAGDLVSGISRGIEASSVAAALACGVIMAYTVLEQFGGMLS